MSIVATVFFQTKFGMRGSNSVAHQTEGTSSEVPGKGVFDFKNLTKNVEASLSKKIQELEEKR